MAEYRIEYSIQRRTDDDDDFVEIGFGSSGAHDDMDAAAYALESMVTRGEWETEPGMPDPDDIMRDIQEARHD